jgi:protein arginine kinase
MEARTPDAGETSGSGRTPAVDRLIARPGPWLDATGSHPAIVLSTRIRLARNLRHVPFTHRAREDELRHVLGSVERAATRASSFGGGSFFPVHELGPLDRTVLVERHLVSHELSDASRPRGLYVAPDERISIMVNEEDHIRLQSLVSGLMLGEAWAFADQADDELDGSLEYAYHDEWGYLTACPTNAGTGLRASVLIHLSALVLTKQIDKVLKGITQMGLAVRGFYGEGTDVMGNLFQISNQTTLGLSEKETLESLERVTRQILSAEERARETLLRDARVQIEDKVFRAFGTLRHGRTMSSQEVVNLCSAVRLGVALNLPELPPLSTLNELLVLTQPAHLQRKLGKVMDPAERNVRRAELVRSILTRNGGDGTAEGRRG